MSAEYGQTYNDKFQYKVRRLEDTFVTTIHDGYIVHVFDITGASGDCSYDQEAVEVKVTREGDIKILNHSSVFHVPASRGQICVPP